MSTLVNAGAPGDPFAKVAKEFPDYDLDTLPPIPVDWTDISWHNDACPSWDTNRGFLIYIDYADVAQREIRDAYRFSVLTYDDEPEMVFGSDSWGEVTAFLLNREVEA